MNLDLLTCSEHGWISHVGIHEAGHATAAVVLGFDFRDVTIQPGHLVYQQMMLGGAVIGAGVSMPTDRPSDWFTGRDDDALVYVLAGSLAEEATYGHALPGGVGRGPGSVA